MNRPPRDYELTKTINFLKRFIPYVPAFLVMNDSQLARAFNLSRERISQIREKLELPVSINYQAQVKERVA